MADLYLSRKSTVSSSPTSSSDNPKWLYGSPNKGSKIHKSSRASGTTVHREDGVEELEMLLEVKNSSSLMLSHHTDTSGSLNEWH